MEELIVKQFNNSEFMLYYTILY